MGKVDYFHSFFLVRNFFFTRIADASEKRSAAPAASGKRRRYKEQRDQH